jgi:hypothetical protein
MKNYAQNMGAAENVHSHYCNNKEHKYIPKKA